MSVSQPVQFGDIKHCVVCGKAAVVHGGAIRCCPQISLSDKDECAALLNSYARDGFMKFCYSCGADMIIEEDDIFCGSCQDTQTFDVPPRTRIQLSDIQHCPICAKELRRINNGVICGRECNFRVVVSGTQSAMNRLTEYAIKGRVKFCYVCGFKANGDALHVMCSQNDCLSCKIPLHESSTDDIQAFERSRSISSKSCCTICIYIYQGVSIGQGSGFDIASYFKVCCQSNPPYLTLQADYGYTNKKKKHV